MFKLHYVMCIYTFYMCVTYVYLDIYTYIYNEILDKFINMHVLTVTWDKIL